MNKIKQRRLVELTLKSHPDLHVGDCVPFYFCPRSVMLYMFHKKNHPELDYDGGQEPILHLQADLKHTIRWADSNHKRWAFTLTNAGSYYFEDRADLTCLNEINWQAVDARNWRDCRDEKQAEFLIEEEFPFELVEKIGVYSQQYFNEINKQLANCDHRPIVQIKSEWYYEG